MTRREFVIKNYGNDVVDDEVFGGIQGCPAHYKKLVDADKSITSGTVYGPCICIFQITQIQIIILQACDQFRKCL